MISILILIAITSIWVLGLTIATQEGMVLYGIRKWASFNTQEEERPTIYQAIILCPWCMPSLHSAIGYGFCLLTGIVEYKAQILYAYPLVVCGASVVSGIIWTVHEAVLAYKDKVEMETKCLTHNEQLLYFDIDDRKSQHQKEKNKFVNKKTFNHEG